MSSVKLSAWLVLCALCCTNVAWANKAPKWKASVSSDGTFHVEGSAGGLPDEAFFYVRVAYAGTVFARTKAMVSEGRFATDLGPFDRDLWAGDYVVTVQLLPGRQLARLREKGSLTPYRLEKTVRYGNKRQEAKEEQARVQHYGQMLAYVRQQLNNLLDYFCSCTRTLPGFSGREGYDAWREWLVVWNLPSPDPKLAGEQIARWKTPVYFVDKSTGAFDEKGWREWVDAYRKGLENWVNTHRGFLAKHVAARYPRSAQDLELAFTTLAKLSGHYSAALYRGQAIPVRREDQHADVRLPNAPKGADIQHLRQLFRAIWFDVKLERAK